MPKRNGIAVLHCKKKTVSLVQKMHRHRTLLLSLDIFSEENIPQYLIGNF